MNILSLAIESSTGDNRRAHKPAACTPKGAVLDSRKAADLWAFAFLGASRRAQWQSEHGTADGHTAKRRRPRMGRPRDPRAQVGKPNGIYEIGEKSPKPDCWRNARRHRATKAQHVMPQVPEAGGPASHSCFIAARHLGKGSNGLAGRPTGKGNCALFLGWAMGKAADIARRHFAKRALAHRQAALSDNEMAAQMARASDQFIASPEWKALRASVARKFGAKCMCCGYAPPADKLHRINVDHIKPRLLFPELALSFDNLQVLCGKCNKSKGNKHFTDYRARGAEMRA